MAFESSAKTILLEYMDEDGEYEGDNKDSFFKMYPSSRSFFSLEVLRSEREGVMSLICNDMKDIERLRISSTSKRKELDDLFIKLKELNWEVDMLEEDIVYVSRIVSENESRRHVLDERIREKIAVAELASDNGTKYAKKRKVDTAIATHMSAEFLSCV